MDEKLKRVQDIAVHFSRAGGRLQATAVTVDGALLPHSSVEIVSGVNDIGYMRLSISTVRVRIVLDDDLEQEEDPYAVSSEPLK
jgi:hypothetical protein